MTGAFADTSFFVACLGRHDAHHMPARRLMESYTESIVTTEWVLAAHLGDIAYRGNKVAMWDTAH